MSSAFLDGLGSVELAAAPDPTGLDRDCQFTSFLTVSGRALFLRESICAVKQACESSLVGGALWRRRAQPEMALPRRGRQGSQGGAITRGWPGARRRRWRMAGASGRSRRSARSSRRSGFRTGRAADQGSATQHRGDSPAERTPLHAPASPRPPRPDGASEDGAGQVLDHPGR